MVHPPEPTQLTLGAGVDYVREVQSGPSLVWHVVRIDLGIDGIAIEGPDADATLRLPLIATQPSKALAPHEWVLAFSAGAFTPSASEGQPVAPLGRATTRGVTLPNGGGPETASTLQVRPGLPAVIDAKSSGGAFTEVSSECDLLRAGAVLADLATCPDASANKARLGIGLDKTGRTMWVAMADGRLAKSSVGVTATQLAEKLKSVGADRAAQFTSGDMVTMSARFPGSQAPTVLGTPVSDGVPGREPVVGYIVGVKAAPRL